MSLKITNSLRFLLPLLVFIGIAFFLFIGLKLDPSKLPSTKINKPAPDFNLAQLHKPESRVSPKQLLGESWILNVWASWCISCRVEHPLLNQLSKNSDIKIVGLNFKDKAPEARQWLAERGNPYYLTAFDPKGDAGIDWGVYAVPETFVINPKGVIIYKYIGALNVDIINKEILPLFKQSTDL